MTDLELLKVKLEEAKEELESNGYVLGEEGELIDLFPAMKQYEYAFQNAIEEIWPDKLWWQMTNYWDIFQNSIMSGKTADEVIEDIMNHIFIEDEDKKEFIMDKPGTEDDFDIDDEYESLDEAKEKSGTKIVYDKIVDELGSDNHKYELKAQTYDRGPNTSTYTIRFTAPNDWFAFLSMCLHTKPSLEELEDYFGDDGEDLDEMYEEYPSIESMSDLASGAWWGDGDDYIIYLKDLTSGEYLYEGEEQEEPIDLDEAKEEVKINDSIFELVKDLSEGE